MELSKFKPTVKRWLNEVRDLHEKATMPETGLVLDKLHFTGSVMAELEDIYTDIKDGYCIDIHWESERRFKDSLAAIRSWFLPEQEWADASDVRDFRRVIYSARQDMEDLCDSASEAMEETRDYDKAIRELDKIARRIGTYKMQYPVSEFEALKKKYSNLLPANYPID